MRRRCGLVSVLCLLALLVLPPLVAQAAPCEECLDGAEASDCQPGSPDCGCCLVALPLAHPSPPPALVLPSAAFPPEPHGLSPAAPPDDVLHVPRR